MEIKELIKNEEFRSYLIEVVKEAIQESKPKRKPRAKKAEVDKTVTEKIYDLYPNQCPVRGARTGKSVKNLEQIQAKFKGGYVPCDLFGYIQYYVNDCTDNKVYLKNFSTFLNNLPGKDEIKKLAETGLKSLFLQESNIEVRADGYYQYDMLLNPVRLKEDYNAWKTNLF